MSSNAERLWYSPVVEAVFLKGPGEQLTPGLRAELKKIGLDLSKLQPAYPLTMVHQACRVVIPVLFPGRSDADALHALGVSSMRGYSETLLGKALMQVLKLIGVRRSLLRMHTTMRAGNNYLSTSAVVVNDHCVELRLSDVSEMPTFYQGIIEEGARMAHAKNLRITSADSAPPGHTFRVEWDE